MEKIIIYSIIGVLITLLLSYLNKQSKTKISPIKEDYYELRINKAYWYFFIISIVIGLLGFIISIIEIEVETGLKVGLTFLVLFGSLGSYFAFWYINHKLNFDSRKIEVKSFYGKISSIKWNEIKLIKFNLLSGLLILTDNKQNQIKVHMHLVGFGELLKMMESKTNWKIKDLKIPI